MSLEISASESGEKDGSVFVLVVEMCVSVSDEENCLLMRAVLLVKNDAKSSAVRVDEGGGGGGQRREENVLKSWRESEQLLILLW